MDHFHLHSVQLEPHHSSGLLCFYGLMSGSCNLQVGAAIVPTQLNGAFCSLTERGKRNLLRIIINRCHLFDGCERHSACQLESWKASSTLMRCVSKGARFAKL